MARVLMTLPHLAISQRWNAAQSLALRRSGSDAGRQGHRAKVDNVGREERSAR